MEKEDVINGNKLIAEFMGLKSRPLAKGLFQVQYEHGFSEHGFKEFTSEGMLKFHSSWNWLMPVIDKIESLNYSVTIGSAFRKDKTQRIYCEIGTPEMWDFDLMLSELDESIADTDEKNGNSKIENVFYAVVEFIKWYNKRTTLSL